MKFKCHVCLFLALFLTLECTGTSDIPYYYEVPICSNGIENSDTVPFYEFDKPPQPFDKRSSSRVSEDTPVLQAISWKDFILRDSDIPYLAISTTNQKSNSNRKKRSVEKVRLEDALEDSHQYGVEVLSPFPRQNRNTDTIKTIQFPSSFTPRFGRKRSGPQATDSFSIGDTIDRFYVPSDVKREIRSEGAARIHLNAGSAFTPRLGRSKSFHKIHLNAGSAFTPRLGRSNDPNLLQLTSGSAPRLSRSEDYNRVQVNAGSAFTPRLGRSEGSLNRIHLNAGSAFTPRLGRSEDHYRVQLNAGSAFTPRFGRSHEPQSISLNAGSAFTPRLGRSEQPNLISLNAGNAFTPRLG